MPKNYCIMQIWAEFGKSALPICNYSQILYQFLTFTQNLKRSLVGIIVAIVSVVAIFGGALMKLFGFTYQSMGSIILFFVISGILAFPIELFVKAIPKVLFSHFKKINELEAKIMFVVLDTVLSMIMFSLVDYFMKSVSATPISLFVVSLIMSLLCMNDVIEKKDR